MLDNVRVVMVETTHPGNIGAAARAMKTMGLSDLRLVAPKSYPSVEATARASGAGDVLAAAGVCASLDEALDGATLVIGTSARQRRIPWPCVTPRQLAAQLQREPADTRIAVMFGREDRGLTNDELRRCNLHVTVPSNPEYGVLNVASAVQLIAYELRLALVGEDPDLPDARSRRELMPLPEMFWDEPAAGNEAVQQFLEHLERVMAESGFLDQSNPGQVMTRMRRLFLRARPDKMEISILRGTLVALEKAMRASTSR
ncbi:RNA methyltransferase [Alloalcanivorax mobilis]|uniref:RNA methyltransferase n=1 Tax=Alloalcanivorax mobilis TaxID=2019569 RepID=UPI000B5B47D8|nr:RNA methyltransferase [Alloalcanivorax mobilis]ASK34991.1 tRNA (cytosine(32)/uridine(32)-2'-O)-methyltransferase TrmJ [Alcanivorax sp. N3-2A]|tara:strand:- start:1095 stop:1868 length:774 start_codon:yes stop_codon:yes gene_type:complete